MMCKKLKKRVFLELTSTKNPFSPQPVRQQLKRQQPERQQLERRQLEGQQAVRRQLERQ
jgi:hypothetical protein